MACQIIPGDYEQQHGPPGPHESVCPKRRPDPKYSGLMNPCGRALGHAGDCSPMSSIQKQRRINQAVAEAYARRREAHKKHETFNRRCLECLAEKADAEFLAGVK